MRLSYFWFFLAAILIGGTGRLISQATTQDPVIRVSVDLVQVDATVTDSQGHHVADLKPGDFTILEDGRLQKITYFLYEQGGLSQNASRLGNVNPLAARPPVARDIRRTVVLVADDLSYEAAEFPRVRAVFKDFVDRNMQPRDLVSVMTTSGGMGELEQLTSDKRILSAAIERIVFSPARNQLGASISSENAGVAHHYDFKRDDTALAANRRPAVVTGSTIALGNAIQALRDMPGRKAVVLFTSGFSGPPAPLVEMANRSSVVIYTFDARGLLAFPPPDFFSTEGPMNRLASDTGGVFFHNTNGFNAALAEAMGDMSS